MEWLESTAEGLTIINLKGEIDLQFSPALRALLQTQLKKHVPILLLDFGEVDYIDSSGLATLVEYYQQSRSHSARIAADGRGDVCRGLGLGEPAAGTRTTVDRRDRHRPQRLGGDGGIRYNEGVGRDRSFAGDGHQSDSVSGRAPVPGDGDHAAGA